MAVLAVQHIRRMRGGAQGHLMLCADGHLYVVKFQNNPQHLRVLANELIATRLAAAAGLTVPPIEVVEVTPWLIENTPELQIDLGKSRIACRSGLQFGSRFAGGLMPGQVIDYLPEEQLGQVRNIGEFAGILALDKWTGNANGRQAVFVRSQRERYYRAVFIDFGYCFHAGEWRFDDHPLRGVYFRNEVYRGIRGWSSFQPWLSKIETMPDDTIWSIANSVLAEWYDKDLSAMETLIRALLTRRERVREWVESFRISERNPFPNWGLAPPPPARQSWTPSPLPASIVGRVN